jgi:hypothetical protein
MSNQTVIRQVRRGQGKKSRNRHAYRGLARFTVSIALKPKVTGSIQESPTLKMFPGYSREIAKLVLSVVKLAYPTSPTILQLDHI